MKQSLKYTILVSVLLSSLAGCGGGSSETQNKATNNDKTPRSAGGTTTSKTSVKPPKILSNEITETRKELAILHLKSDKKVKTVINYGLTTNYGLDIGEPSYNFKNHEEWISGLKENTTYHYQVIITDKEGNTTTGKDKIFHTKGLSPKKPKLLTSEVKEERKNLVILHFSSDKKVTTIINYGLTTNYGLAAKEPSYNFKEHEEWISDLKEGTTYHYKITITDKAGNSFTSDDKTFHTAGTKPKPTPSIITSLSDYSFIDDGYGILTTPSMPDDSGYQKPYVPDLTNIKKANILYVAPEGKGTGKNKDNPASLRLLSNPEKVNGKTIIALDGKYTIEDTIALNQLKNVNLIAKHKGEATLKASKGTNIFKFADNFPNTPKGEEELPQTSGSNHFSIIGFNATGHGKSTSLLVASDQTDDISHIYISDMVLHNFDSAIYSGLHSHDWTIDKSIQYASGREYIWYMMGWHHSIINSVMFNNAFYSISIRGSYPKGKRYHNTYPEGDSYDENIRISKREENGEEHFLSKNDWTHLIANNTFGSTEDWKYKNVHEDHKSKAHITIYYARESNRNNEIQIKKTEDVYYPPKNILISNNVFKDNGIKKKYPLIVRTDRGVNGKKLTSINGIKLINNYTDRDNILTGDNGKKEPLKNDATGKTHHVIMEDNRKNFTEYSFDNKYHINEDSKLKNASNTSVWTPNSSLGGNERDEQPDVGAYEVSQ